MMGLGKMNSYIELVAAERIQDAEGFVTSGDRVIASLRAYREERHGNLTWANRAAFSTATALFRFRKIPGIAVDTSMFIVCADGRYTILSVEDVKGRGMYYEALAEKVVPSGR